jgi:YVTN family beta-propeller protein
MKLNKLILVAFILGLVFTSCSDDDDNGISVSEVSIQAGQVNYDEAAANAIFTMVSTQTFTSDIVITYSVSGTAEAGLDYGVASGSLIMLAGESSVDLSIAIIDDAELEADETLIITIETVDGSLDLISNTNSATISIIDNETAPFEDGILISHEGNFGQGNASVSFVSFDLQTVENNIYSTVNSNPLGDVAQSIGFNGDFAYIVLNVSNAIEVVNRYTFESVATINTGLNNPRFIAFANGKGYVTNWGDGSVSTDDYLAIINLDSNTLDSQTIPVAEGCEEIVANGNTLYVAHQGGFSQNNVVSVVDATSNTVSSTITVGDVPNSMQLDGSGNLWVLAGGKPSWTGDETGGKLSKINTSDNSVTSIDFATTEHPNHLALDNGAFYYYTSGSVFKMATSATTLPTTAELTGLNFYGMTVDNSVLYGVNALDFTSNGILSTYNLSSNTLEASATVNIIPGGIYFN